MALDYHRLKAHAFAPARQAYGEDDCILYALGVGAGLAEDEAIGEETEFIYEDGLRALPAMAAVLAYPGFWMRDPDHGLAWGQVVHGEQRMRFAAPLPPRGEVSCRMEVSHVADKGPGAFVITRRTLSDAVTGRDLAVIEQLNICRGDAGYSGGDAALSDVLPSPIPAPPAAPPDSIVVLPTSRNQAALYRLNADRNPLHVDPPSARQAGYPRPILHGAALLGMVNRALQPSLRQLPGLRLRALDLRFLKPVYPGLPVTVSLWRQPQGLALACHQADALCAQGRGVGGGERMMNDKTCADARDALRDVESGASIFVGGFGGSGIPARLLAGLLAKPGVGDLTLINNNAGAGEASFLALVASGRVSRIICSYPRMPGNDVIRERVQAGGLIVEVMPQGTMVERIRAGGAGMGPFYSPTGHGTPLAEGKETRVFGGRGYVLEEPLRADFAFVRAHRGDRLGNLVYRRAQRNFGPVMCMAARTTIVEVDEILPCGALDPDIIVTPSLFVHRLLGGPQ